jgi:hypothetical protein
MAESDLRPVVAHADSSSLPLQENGIAAQGWQDVGVSGALTGTNMHAFMRGLRAGQRMHILVSSCNTTIITDVIVPDFLPPAYTSIEQTRHSFGTDTKVRNTLLAADVVHQVCAQALHSPPAFLHVVGELSAAARGHDSCPGHS